MREDAELRELRERVRTLETQLAASRAGGAGPVGCIAAAAGMVGLLVIAGGVTAFMLLRPRPVDSEPTQVQQARQAAEAEEAQARAAAEVAQLQAQLAEARAQAAVRGAAPGDPLAATAYVDDDAVYDGRVTETTGASHVHVGDTCRVDLEWTNDPSRNCRALVDCGTRHVYGDVGQGWFPCQASADEGLRTGQDDYPTAQDGDPRFRVDRVEEVVQVSDDGPAWTMTLAISPRPEEEDDGYERGGGGR